MAFRATNVLPSDALQEIKRISTHLRNFCLARVAAWATGANADDILGTVDQIRNHRDRIMQLASTPGLVAYAVAQENDVAYDVVTEAQNMIAAFNGFIATVASLVPTDGTGYILMYTVDSDMTRIPRSFPNVAPLITDLQAIVDAIV